MNRDWRSGPRAVPRGPDVTDDRAASNLIMRSATTVNQSSRANPVTTLNRMTQPGDYTVGVRHRSGSVTEFHYHQNDTDRVGAIQHTDRHNNQTRYSGHSQPVREQQREVTALAVNSYRR